MKTYDLVVIGSGFRSVGIAEGVKNSLIVESSYLADPVHYGTLSGFTLYQCEDFSAKTDEIRRIFSEHRVLEDGKIDVPALESCLSEYTKRRGINLLLGALPIEITSEDGISTVVLHTTSGEMSIRAKRVVRHESREPDSIRFLMHGDATDLSFSDIDGMSFTVGKAFFDNEFILTAKSNVPTEAMHLVPTALRKLTALIAGTSVRIKAVAHYAFSSFDSDITTDPISSFAIGLREGKELLN